MQGPAHLGRLIGMSVSAGWPPPELADALSIYARELSADATHLGWGVWLVLPRAQPTLAGSVGFKGKPDADACVEIGYGIEPGFRGRGYATEATAALVGWGWRQGVRRIVAECRDDNPASIRVLEKVGMRKIGERGRMLWWDLRRPW